MAMHFLLLSIAAYLISAIKNRERTTLILHLVMSGVCMLCNFMQLYTGNSDITASSIIAILIQGYGLTTFSSLYHEFKTNESMV